VKEKRTKEGQGTGNVAKRADVKEGEGRRGRRELLYPLVPWESSLTPADREKKRRWRERGREEYDTPG